MNFITALFFNDIIYCADQLKYLIIAFFLGDAVQIHQSLKECRLENSDGICKDKFVCIHSVDVLFNPLNDHSTEHVVKGSVLRKLDT